MIQVRRPAVVPLVLQTRGAAATRQLCDAYDASPADYMSGQLLFTFDRGIYGHTDVKAALCQAQYEKCCFCESKVMHIAFGDVEHFRPKAAVRQRPSGPLLRPGYYWLAYEWTNLFFCCQRCNQRFKQDFFPLRRPRSRAKSHHDDPSREEPLFLNPEEDPSRHIRFRNEYAEPVRRSRRGRITIDALGLNREELVTQRLNRLLFVRALQKSRKCLWRRMRLSEARGEPIPAEDRACIAEVDDRLAEVVANDAEYAAMVPAALA
jgi:uncharacterized protein (TIGR02646 family)